MSLIAEFARKGIINPVERLLQSGLYEVAAGSHAFGTVLYKSDDVSLPASDREIYGFYISKDPQENEEFRVLNVLGEQRGLWREYDIVLYPVRTFFERCLNGKSQSLETLFVDDANLITVCEGASLVRDSRKLFLSQEAAREFQRFAHAQYDDMVNVLRKGSKSQVSIDTYGYDVKAACHSVRLLCETQQMLVDCDLNLLRNKEMLLEIRSGKWSKQQVIEKFDKLNAEVEGLFATTRLPEQANRDEILRLFERCIEAENGKGVTGQPFAKLLLP